MYRTVLESNNIRSRSDYDYLKKVNSEAEQKAAPLKEHFERCRQLYDLYSDIAKTYREISQGDYISRLVEEERQIRERNNRTNRRILNKGGAYKNRLIKYITAYHLIGNPPNARF